MLGLYWDNGKEHGNYYNGLYRVYNVVPRAQSKGFLQANSLLTMLPPKAPYGR